VLIIVACIVGVIITIFLGIPVAFSLGIWGIIGMVLIKGGITSAMAVVPFATFSDFMFTPLPLFIMMGVIITISGMGERIFETFSKWLGRLPGGLAVATVWTNAMLAAAVGSTSVCIATTSKMAIPEMEKRGYNSRLAMGALCSSSGLAVLIPPSSTMVLYSVMTDISLGKLFMAGMIPGIVLAIILSLYIITNCAIHPDLAPPPPPSNWKDRISSLHRIWFLVVIIFFVLFTIYLGVATPTEAASLGTVATMVLAILFFGSRLPQIRRILSDTGVTYGMIAIIIVSATIFSYTMMIAGLPQIVTHWVASLEVNRWIVIIIINLILILLGCVMDPICILLVTVPIFAPVVSALGFDLVWFGIVNVVNFEIAVMTPPYGMNLFIMSGVLGVPTDEVVRGVMPFIVLMILFLVIVVAFPQLSLWLPSTMWAGR